MPTQIVLPEDFSVEERGEKAERLFMEGYNCAQSVVLAFSDLIPEVSRDSLGLLSSGFGGGFGRLREVCGAVSGMTMMAGILSPVSCPSDMSARSANYALVQKFADEFKEKRGSIICRDLLNIRAESKEIPTPSERTPEYYRTRPCTVNVGLAARIIAREIVNMTKNLG